MTPTDDLATVLEAAERALDLRKVIGSGANLQEEAKALARLVKAAIGKERHDAMCGVWNAETTNRGCDCTLAPMIAEAARSIRGKG